MPMAGGPTAEELEQSVQAEDLSGGGRDIDRGTDTDSGEAGEDWRDWLADSDAEDEGVASARFEDRRNAAAAETSAATVDGGHSHYYDRPPDQALIDRSGGGGRASASLPSRPRRREPRGFRPLAAIGVVLGVVTLVVSVLVITVSTDKATTLKREAAVASTTVAPASTTVVTASTIVTAPPTAAAPPHAHTMPGCTQARSEGRVSGTGPGGTGNGPDAILAFEHAYYVLRSGAAARAVVEGAAIPDAEGIQRGIDQVPVDTRYCVEISALSDGRYLVDLSEQWPGETAATFTQVVTVTSRDGRTLITAIAPA
ncbi:MULTISPECIES: hypothetical protein [Nocardia]|uniref:hypothetical protein n=1 Tax=Nocardia TaxID=1817 RepID=UPI001357555F|nr:MULTISPECIES: hypothetical protein [Nocardia]